MGHKRRREDTTKVSRRTEVYEDLAHLDQAIRLKAAQTLLTELVPDANADQSNEILRRLIRGLCSGRKAARLGFSVALTELLSSFQEPQNSASSNFPDISGVVEILLNQTQVGGGADGQENRDHQIGRLFGAEAILKSGILFQPQFNNAVSNRVLDLILELAKKKPWLREQCGFVLYRSFEDTAKADSSFAQSTIDRLQKFGLIKTPEGVAIWITISRQFPTVKLPIGIWRKNTPLCREERSRLALILKEASASNLDSADPDAQRGSWSPNLHFAWVVVLKELVNDGDVKTSEVPSERLSFTEFWHDCVEDALFGSTSSDERKYWGLSLFQQGLSLTTTPEQITTLFSEKLVQCLANQLASKERYLHRAAERARKTVVDKAAVNQDFKTMIIEALVGNGHVAFDKISKTRTIEEILSGMDEPASSQICEIYKAAILHLGVTDPKLASQARQVGCDQLFSAAKSMQMRSKREKLDDQSSGRVIRKILSLLTAFAYFDLNANARPEISTTTRNYFRSRLSSCLTYLTANTKEAAGFAAYVTTVIGKREEFPVDARLLLEAEIDVQEVLDQALKLIRRLEKDLEKKEITNRSFIKSGLLLISVVFLQVHDGELDAIGMLEELNEAFSNKHMKDNAERGEQSATALIEVLLGLAAKPSKLFRRLSQQVFESIAEDVDEDILQSMLKILNAKENSEGQDELFDVDHEELEGQDEEQHDSEASDVEISNMRNSSQEIQISDDAHSTVSSSLDEDEGDDSEEDLAAFNAKLAQALGTRPGNEDLNADEDSTSDADMNDEEMEALDEHLANVFREQKKAASKKTERKDAKKNIVGFKCRVLELLEIFVKKQHRKPLAMHLLPSVLALQRTTSSPQVSQKASDLLRDYSRLSKGKELPQIEDSEAVVHMLESIHQEALMPGSNAHANSCSQASLLLVRTLANHNKETLREIVRIYAKTYVLSHEKALFEKNFKAKMSLFTDFNNWAASFGK